MNQTDRTIPDAVKRRILDRVKWLLHKTLLYEANTEQTWKKAEHDIRDMLAQDYSAEIASLDIRIDGTNYHDIIAQNSETFDEYRFKYVMAYGKDCPFSERDYMARHNIRSPEQIYVMINIVYADGMTTVIQTN